MKNAQVDPRQQVQVVSGWTTEGMPILSTLPASARIIEVSDTTWPVADPMFWVPCADNVLPDQWYYDMVSQEILVVPPPAPRPAAADQPVVSGAQTL